MNEHFFWVMITVVFASAVLAGLWWANVKWARNLLGLIHIFFRICFFVALIGGIAAGILYLFVKVIRLAWG